MTPSLVQSKFGEDIYLKVEGRDKPVMVRAGDVQSAIQELGASGASFEQVIPARVSKTDFFTSKKLNKGLLVPVKDFDSFVEESRINGYNASFPFPKDDLGSEFDAKELAEEVRRRKELLGRAGIDLAKNPRAIYANIPPRPGLMQKLTFWNNDEDNAKWKQSVWEAAGITPAKQVESMVKDVEPVIQPGTGTPAPVSASKVMEELKALTNEATAAQAGSMSNAPMADKSLMAPSAPKPPGPAQPVPQAVSDQVSDYNIAMARLSGIEPPAGSDPNLLPSGKDVAAMYRQRDQQQMAGTVPTEFVEGTPQQRATRLFEESQTSDAPVQDRQQLQRQALEVDPEAVQQYVRQQQQIQKTASALSPVPPAGGSIPKTFAAMTALAAAGKKGIEEGDMAAASIADVPLENDDAMSRIVNNSAKTWLASRAQDLLAKPGSTKAQQDEAMELLTAAQRIPENENMQEFNAGGMRMLKSLLKPETYATLTADMFASMGRSYLDNAGMMASPGRLGAALAATSGYSVEYAGAFFTALSEAAPKDKDGRPDIRAALEDPKVIQEAIRRGEAKAGPITLLDVASAGVAGRIFNPAVKGGATVRRALGDLAVTSTLDMGGEALGQVNAGEELDIPSIVAEGVSTGPQNVISYGKAFASNFKSERDMETLKLDMIEQARARGTEFTPKQRDDLMDASSLEEVQEVLDEIGERSYQSELIKRIPRGREAILADRFIDEDLERGRRQAERDDQFLALDAEITRIKQDPNLRDDEKDMKFLELVDRISYFDDVADEMGVDKSVAQSLLRKANAGELNSLTPEEAALRDQVIAESRNYPELGDVTKVDERGVPTWAKLASPGATSSRDEQVFALRVAKGQATVNTLREELAEKRWRQDRQQDGTLVPEAVDNMRRLKGWLSTKREALNNRPATGSRSERLRAVRDAAALSGMIQELEQRIAIAEQAESAPRETPQGKRADRAITEFVSSLSVQLQARNDVTEGGKPLTAKFKAYMRGFISSTRRSVRRILRKADFLQEAIDKRVLSDRFVNELNRLSVGAPQPKASVPSSPAPTPGTRQAPASTPAAPRKEQVVRGGFDALPQDFVNTLPRPEAEATTQAETPAPSGQPSATTPPQPAPGAASDLLNPLSELDVMLAKYPHADSTMLNRDDVPKIIRDYLRGLFDSHPGDRAMSLFKSRHEMAINRHAERGLPIGRDVLHAMGKTRQEMEKMRRPDEALYVEQQNNTKSPIVASIADRVPGADRGLKRVGYVREGDLYVHPDNPVHSQSDTTESPVDSASPFDQLIQELERRQNEDLQTQDDVAFSRQRDVQFPEDRAIGRRQEVDDAVEDARAERWMDQIPKMAQAFFSSNFKLYDGILSADEMESVMMQTFAKIVGRKFDDEAAFDRYVKQAMYNAVRNEGRRMSRRRGKENSSNVEIGEEGGDTFQDQMTGDDVNAPSSRDLDAKISEMDNTTGTLAQQVMDASKKVIDAIGFSGTGKVLERKKALAEQFKQNLERIARGEEPLSRDEMAKAAGSYKQQAGPVFKQIDDAIAASPEIAQIKQEWREANISRALEITPSPEPIDIRGMLEKQKGVSGEQSYIEAESISRRSGTPAARPARGTRIEPGLAKELNQHDKDLRERQSSSLVEWAKKTGLYIEPEAFDAEWNSYAKKNGMWLGGNKSAGAEHRVYYDELAGVWFKSADVAMFHKDYAEYFRRLAWHKEFFPETAYTFVGITIGSDGLASPVVAQDHIVFSGAADNSEINSLLVDRLGFIQVGTMATVYYVRGDVKIEDLHDENVFLSGDGIAVIDPVIYSERMPAKTSTSRSVQIIDDPDWYEQQAQQNHPDYTNPREYRKDSLWKESVVPLSALLGGIDPNLKIALREYERNQQKWTSEWSAELKPFLEDLQKIKKNRRRYEALATALMNGHANSVRQLLTRYGFDPAHYDRAQAQLDRIHKILKDLGLSMGKQDNYWPRLVVDYAGLRTYLEKEHGIEWNKFESAVFDEARRKGAPLTAYEETEIIATMVAAQTRHGRFPHKKERVFSEIHPAMTRYYDDPVNTMVRYLDNAAEIAARNMAFQKISGPFRALVKERVNKIAEYNDPNTPTALLPQLAMDISVLGARIGSMDMTIGDASKNLIGVVVADLLRDGRIQHQDIDKIRRYFQSRFEYKPIGTFGRGMKTLAYLTTLVHVKAAIRNMADITPTLASAGILRGITMGILPSTLKNFPVVGKLLVGKKWVTMQDVLGEIKLNEEFLENGLLSGALRMGFKVVGFNRTDKWAKESLMNARLSKIKSLARDAERGSARAKAALAKELRDVFTVEELNTPSVIAELAAQTKTEAQKRVAYNALADHMPVSKSEMPVNYLRGRQLPYMYRSYLVKFWDYAWRKNMRRMGRAFKDGDPVEFIAAAKDMVMSSAYALGFNVLATMLISAMLNRDDEDDWKELWFNEGLNLIGWSRYLNYQIAQENGLLLTGANFVAPHWAPALTIANDLQKWHEKGDKWEGPSSTRMIPVIAQFLYYGMPFRDTLMEQSGITLDELPGPGNLEMNAALTDAGLPRMFGRGDMMERLYPPGVGDLMDDAEEHDTTIQNKARYGNVAELQKKMRENLDDPDSFYRLAERLKATSSRLAERYRDR